MAQLFFPDWRDHVVYSPEGPQPFVFVETDKFKVVVVGLEAGQKIPPHPEGAGLFHFLEGTGTVTVDDQEFSVKSGSTVVIPAGSNRGINALTRLTFLASRALNPNA